MKPKSLGVTMIKWRWSSFGSPFPPFKFDGFDDAINVSGGEMSWKTLHDVHDEDKKLESHLRKAPKISYKVLHPGNNKQSVPIALSIFDATTSAAIESYFPDRKASADFLRLIDTWWVISNAKQEFSSRRIGHAVKKGDKKPEFLRKFADWIELWRCEKIANCEKFTLSAQTAGAFIRTLRGQASLLEDLLSEGYRYEFFYHFYPPLHPYYIGIHKKISDKINFGQRLIRDKYCSESKMPEI